MADNLDKTGKEDDSRINVHQDWELRDWSQKLGVTPDQLKQLVKDNGPMVADVRKALGQ